MCQLDNKFFNFHLLWETYIKKKTEHLLKSLPTKLLLIPAPYSRHRMCKIIFILDIMDIWCLVVFLETNNAQFPPAVICRIHDCVNINDAALRLLLCPNEKHEAVPFMCTPDWSFFGEQLILCVSGGFKFSVYM